MHTSVYRTSIYGPNRQQLLNNGGLVQQSEKANWMPFSSYMALAFVGTPGPMNSKSFLFIRVHFRSSHNFLLQTALDNERDTLLHLQAPKLDGTTSVTPVGSSSRDVSKGTLHADEGSLMYLSL